MQKIALAVIDGHPAMVEGLSAVLKRELNADIVALGSQSQDIEDICKIASFDVMILDIEMPGDPLCKIAAATKAMPRIKIVVFTGLADPELAAQALDAGARGYILKTSTASEVVAAIGAVLSGQIFVTPSFASTLVKTFRAKNQIARAKKEVYLSVRERQIISLLMAGKKNREIGLILNLNENTIKGYMTNLIHKLEVKSRLEVILAAQNFDSSLFDNFPVLH